MSNLQNFNNIYADLAESAYNTRSDNFPYEQLKPSQQKALDSGKSVKFNFNQTVLDSQTGKIITYGGQNLPNNGVVYLQPDLPAQVQLPANPTASGTGQPTVENMVLSEKERTVEISA